MANPSAPPAWLAALRARRTQGHRPPEKARGRWLGDFLTESTPSGLLDTEFDLLEACARGLSYSVSPVLSPPSPKTSPSDPEGLKSGLLVVAAGLQPWRVRAGFVRFLALGGDESAPVHEAGVDLRGAYIDAPLDLRGGACVSRLTFVECVIDGPPQVEDATLGNLCLDGSKIRGLQGARAVMSGSLLLRQGFHCDGEVTISGAQIGGDLQADGGRFDNRGGDAIDAAGAWIKGSVAMGQIRLADPHSPERVVPGDRFEARGRVNLAGARIDGSIAAGGGRFLNPDPNGVALLLSLTRVGGQVALNQPWWREGRGETERIVALDRFETDGFVSLYGAVIASHLDCTGGRFQPPRADAKEPLDDRTPAIDGQIMEVGGCVFFNRAANAITTKNHALKGFSSSGEVRLLAARIGLQLNCLGGEFSNTGPAAANTLQAPWALNLQRARVGLEILLGPAQSDDNDPAVIRGAFDLRGASAGGLSDRMFVGPDGPTADCFPETVRTTGGETLRCDLRLNGFTYDRLDPDATLTAQARQGWIMRQPADDTGENLLNQPFDHLSRVLDSMGRDEEARRIRIFKEDCLTRAVGRKDKIIGVALLALEAILFWNGLVWPAVAGLVIAALVARYWRSGARSAEWVWRAAFGALVGYGYRPGRGLGAALMVALLAGGYYQAAQAGGDLTLEKPKGAAESPGSTQARPFHPYIYSLEVMLPVAKLGEADAWKPADKGFDVRAPTGRRLVALDRDFTRKVVWLETAFGWLAGGILVAMVSGLVKTGAAKP